MNWVYALATAVLLFLTVPRFDISWLAAVALAPLVAAVHNEGRAGRRFLLGWTAGVVYWFAVCYWIQAVLQKEGGLGVVGGWAAFLLFCAAKAVHLGVFAALAGLVVRKWYAIPAVAALWTGIERTHAPLGFTWHLLGNSGIDMGVPMRLAPFVGVYGVSFVLAMMSVAVALVILRRSRLELAWLTILPLLYLLPALPAPKRGTEQAVVVQPNVSEQTQWSKDTIEQFERKVETLSLTSAMQPDAPPARVILWPELPAPLYYFEEPRLRGSVATLARLTQSSVILGVVGRGKEGAPMNTAVAVAPSGDLAGRYDKVNLVPFGEYVPRFFGFVNKITTEAGDFQPGEHVVVFPTNGHKAGVFICYESVFANFVRQFANQGAEVLINLSNDGYFAKSAAREQHLKIMRMRAAENGRWIVRATNDGITAVVDPAGRITQRLQPYVEMATRVEYSYESAKTFYTRFGDWFAWACLAVGLLLCGVTQIPTFHRP